MECIILAGGLGTRLRPVVPHVPKALAPIRGKPFITYLLQRLTFASKIVLAVGHLSDPLIAFCQELPFPIEFSRETEALGTGGAVKLALHRTLGEHVLVVNGDTYLEWDMGALLQAHTCHNAPLTLVATFVADIRRHGHLKIDPVTDEILAFEEKSPRGGSGWINGGVYLMHRALLDPFQGAFSLEHDVFPHVKRYAYRCEGRFIDIGTPESFAIAQGVL